jgi:hypothetical protein
MTSISEQIRERLFECIRQGELETDDLIKIIEHAANDVLNAKTKSNYPKGKISKITGREKCYQSHKWAKGKRFYINRIEFIVDNE